MAKGKKVGTATHMRVPRQRKASANDQSFYEVTCCAGLERFVQRELRRLLGEKHQLSSSREKGEILFGFQGQASDLLLLKTIHDPFYVFPIKGAKPRGLLEPLVFKQAVKAIENFQTQIPNNRFNSFRLSAAGSGTPDLQRIKEAFAKSLSLPEQEAGELFLRLRKSKINANEWELLIRISARPLHHRSWRRDSFRGSLDASIARVMIELVDTQKDETMLDLMCGAGTLSLEQINSRIVKQILALDLSSSALESARRNGLELKSKQLVNFLHADSCAIPLKSESLDTIVANPPWGEALEQKKHLPAIYQGLVKEAARLLKPNGRLCVIVQDSDTFSQALGSAPQLELHETHRAHQPRGFHPTIFLINKR